MRFKDVGLWLLAVLGILAIDVLLALSGLREPKPSDYDRACIVAGFAVLLWAIREAKHEPR